MRKIITINEKQYEMKANLGTATYYRKLTGRDWLSDLGKITRKEVGGAEATEAVIEMAYCMNLHARDLDLEEAEKLLNDKELFRWKDKEDFDLGSFNVRVMKEVIGLWNSQNKTTIEVKNP